MSEEPKETHRLSIDIAMEHMPALNQLKRARNARTYREVVISSLRLLATFHELRQKGHIIYAEAPDGTRSFFEVI